MSTPEGFPTAALERAPQEAVFRQDGSLNEGFLGEHYGIGVEEATQQVTFGSWSGSVATMLADEKCPVGGMVRAAYQEKGVEGVATTFKSLGELDSKFVVTITEATIQREKKN